MHSDLPFSCQVGDARGLACGVACPQYTDSIRRFGILNFDIV